MVRPAPPAKIHLKYSVVLTCENMLKVQGRLSMGWVEDSGSHVLD